VSKEKSLAKAGAPLEAKVAKVVGPRELIMNKGSQDGIKKGMRFAVLDLTAADVTDPDTNENLGSLYMEKTRVEVVRVEERIALARTYERTQSGALAFSSALSALYGVQEPFVAFPGVTTGTFDPQKVGVKRGDRLQEIPPQAEVAKTA
jgi:hypothetical protein